jgi:hypothetical protein
MTQAKLADELLAMDPVDNEPEAANNLATAYANFAADAVGNGIPLAPAGLNLGKTAMTGALTGMSAPGAGITAIPAAIVAFWGAVCGGFAVSFPGSVGATPPPHAALAASFAALMPVNTAADLSKEDATKAIAAIMYADAVLGGIVILPGAPPVPGPIL